MGNTNVKPHPRSRNKKQVHWKAADRPSPPGKPQLISEAESTPDLITIRWAKPNKDGGSSISGYLVEHRRTGSPHWVRATPLLVPFPELTISGLEPGWRYQFRISAQNAVGLSEPSELSEPITVTLQRSAITAPRFTQELQDTTALENEKSEFVVHFLGQPAPKVCWFKDGFEIFSSRRIRISTDQDKSVLTIHQSALSDDGEIKCTATNRAGHVSTKAKLTVEAPPSIRLPRNYEEGLLFELGEMIRLKVSVAGQPVPLVFWSHNGESLHNDDRYDIENGEKCSILKISDAKRTDRGEYQIKAVNKLGEETASFLVTVTDRPSPPGKAKVVMTLGRSVTLSWTTPKDDGGCKIGNYIIEYYRLGWNVWLKAATSRQLTTMLGDLIEGSEYKFRVKAESPYGISEPGEETDVVFIPDPKRGITMPQQARGRSQPRELDPPIAAARKNKRSQSTGRTQEPENTINFDIANAGIPKRPDRNKIKSPPKTPELSPLVVRKEVNAEIFDRASMARDLAYGSPEIKTKKIAFDYSASEESSGSSPLTSRKNGHVENAKEIENKNNPRKETRENIEGSSEFMLVLYPEENSKEYGKNFEFDFDEDPIPPPMSLSAPELSAEPPELLFSLRNVASSTFLLHERAMIRFYQAAEAEEAELEKKRKENRKLSVDIPKIQINSKDDQEIVGLERKHSLRRRLSAGGISQHQVLWAQRRQSLRNPNELVELAQQTKLHKYTPENKRELMMLRQRSESEEREEEEFRKVRQKMELTKQTSTERRKISVVDEEKWEDDYVSSTDPESDYSSDEGKGTSINFADPEENKSREFDSKSSSDNEPFEILTKKKDLPDPNFKPKPILKKTEPTPLIVEKKGKQRSHSPIPQSLTQRERSHSIADPILDPLSMLPRADKVFGQKKAKPRQRSFSLLPQKDLLKKDSLPEEDETKVSPSCSISAVAEISGITAASIVIPNKLLEKKIDAEGAKVMADYYGDIVKNYGQRKRSNPQVPTLESMKASAQTPEPEIISQKDPYPQQPEKPILSDSKNSEPVEKINQKEEINQTVHENKTKEASPYREQNTLSPVMQRKSRKTSPSPVRRSSRTSSGSRRTASKSPVRPENWNKLRSGIDHRPRKTSPSPGRKSRTPSKSPMTYRNPMRASSKSPSPIPMASRKPLLREIMTQTSVGLDAFVNESSRTSTPSEKNAELLANAEVKVKRTIDYIMDLTMFGIACWLYLFSNELFAIPVLLVMVYRQLAEEIKKRTPKWLTKLFQKKKNLNLSDIYVRSS